MAERRLLETCDLGLERELLQAANSGGMPAAARRRALSALGLLVLVTAPATTVRPAPRRSKSAGRARRLIKLGALLAMGGGVTAGSILYLGRQAPVADEHVGATRVEWRPAGSVGAEPRVELALPNTRADAAVFELEPAAETEASSRSERPQTEPSTAR